MAPVDHFQDAPVTHIQHIHWYTVSGIIVGVIGFLVGLSVCVYRCYRSKSPLGSSSRLSNVIKKGLKESSGAGIKKSPDAERTGALKGVKGEGNASSIFGGGKQQDSEINKRDLKSPQGQNGQTVVCKQIRVEGSAENEKDCLAQSPTEKKDQLKETSQDEQKIQKLGSLYFTVEYDQQKTTLVVTILRATELPAKDPTLGTSDPYIKLQLLPEKRQKVKTRVLRKTTNPIYDEIFTFYGIDFNQLQGITLHFVILSFDRFSRDDIIGEVIYPLAGVDIIDQGVSISKEIAPRHIKMHSQGRGELLVSLCYQPAANRLTVVVLKARNLPKMDITGLSDPYVKIYLLYNGQRIAKKKTHVKKRTLNPVFNESFLFDVPCNEGLANIKLEFLLLDWDRMTKNEVVGRLEIGAKLGGQETHHWNEVMNCPRKQIAEWHKLKE